MLMTQELIRHDQTTVVIHITGQEITEGNLSRILHRVFHCKKKKDLIFLLWLLTSYFLNLDVASGNLPTLEKNSKRKEKTDLWWNHCNFYEYIKQWWEGQGLSNISWMIRKKLQFKGVLSELPRSWKPGTASLFHQTEIVLLAMRSTWDKFCLLWKHFMYYYY